MRNAPKGYVKCPNLSSLDTLRMLSAEDSRAVAMKVGIRLGVCNNSPAEVNSSKN